ncbi:hypothetical protein K7X08_035513 [Anisodus acutangulus]|uniref:non-specific serine/threonine protein kinase n=1 Tax=Anisodus acutangulus TaxID=402998 RepID=A0A9Q1LHD6_9SOLA|nr:hypothetical protein K7X08_035513 [Anisodus acutangulus]
MKHSFPPFLTTTLVFFFLTKISLVFSSTSSNLPLQLISLLTLKSSFHDHHNAFSDWDPTLAFSRPGSHIWCSWSGINCDKKTNQITSLDLSKRNLSGTIPEDIRNLVHLHHLNLSGNALEGPLRTVLFEFRFLKTLDISRNSFNSTFPPGVSRLKSLTHLNAYSNDFIGPLPEEVVKLPTLEYLNLGGSYFTGVIPKSYGGFAKLNFLHLAGNKLAGPVLAELGFLKQLEHLEIGYQNFTGVVPAEFSSLSNLNYLDISLANLSGYLPVGLGNLTKLETLLLFKNRLLGTIPPSFGKLTSLKSLDLSDNHLTGTIPEGISGFKELTILNLMNNNLTGEIPQGIGELPNLEMLALWNNSLTGILPQRLGSNAKLQKLDVSSNHLTGPIPPNLCLSNNLVKLILFSNQFIGELPSSLANCTALSRFRIQNNRLNGSIPLGFGFLPNLTYLDMSKNNLSGPIPKDFGNAVKLEYLNISENSFNSELPDSIWSSPTLQIFSASYSDLIGNIPNFKGCRVLYKIELEGNNLTGSIPWDIKHCGKLICMDFRQNSLTGIIPWEISAIPSITEVDLSHNFLTGTIPSNFANSSTIENFNVSYNQLTGPVPSSGSIFSSLHSSSFIGNEGLCGTVIQKPCGTDGLAAGAVEVKPQPKKTAGAIVWIMAAAFGIGLFVLIAGSRCFHANYSQQFSGDREVGPWKLTAFQRLNFTADDVLECLTMTDKILGMGSTGTVYKAEMPGGETIAVKKLWGKHKETIRKRRGVLAEVDVLGNPSNILLDGEMEARVADFGVAKLIQCDESMSIIAGSYGYIAPEYAYTSQVDEKSDIYSYGVVLMEILSGKRSVEPEFGDGNSIVDWIRSKLKTKNGINDVLDKNAGASCLSVREEMMLLLRVAVLCTSRNPADRPSMRDVMSMLQEAKPKRKLPGIVGAGDNAIAAIPLAQKANVEC